MYLYEFESDDANLFSGCTLQLPTTLISTVYGCTSFVCAPRSSCRCVRVPARLLFDRSGKVDSLHVGMLPIIHMLDNL